MKRHWTAADIPDLHGKVAIVTGASSGVGFEIARQLALHHARVVLASRDIGRTEQAAGRIKALDRGVGVEAHRLDLGNLASVDRFASFFLRSFPRLDILINNAGVSGGPRRVTPDGFEINFQVNYLGHFALTGLLLPALMRQNSRVVTMSSDIASSGQINFSDLQSEHKYGFIAAYAQAKLANLLFAFELDRRCREASVGITSLATNPGVAASNLFVNKEADWGRPRNAAEDLLRIIQRMLALPTEKGALPALYQATDPWARSEEYVVGGKRPKSGYPSAGKIPPTALDRTAAERLWKLAEALSGVRYDALTVGIAR
jgi:NAD(P)-dependent dehydrogenase (short-subunit alcohol dehydrogenase family)